MEDAARQVTSPTARGNHFSCSLTAVLIARVHAYGGEEAVGEALRLARSERSFEYLTETSNWVSYDEAIALWDAGRRVTHHPQFPRVVGEDAARRLNASPVANLLRSLGSPEEVYRQLAIASARFSTTANLEAVTAGPGYAEIVSTPGEGFPRHPDHCAWTCGLLTQPPVLFGLAPAIVEHDECMALGASRCLYRIIWDVEQATASADAADQIQALRDQLDAMRERMRSVFETASDLIGPDEIDDILARITDRAAVEVRAPRYLLAVRTTPEGAVHCHQKGFDEHEVTAYAERLLDDDLAALPDTWLVVPVRSHRRDYGRLLAAYDDGRTFFPQERELLEVYARYAANALDSATALIEAKQRYGQSSALLALARALASAGTSGEIARRLADAVPGVVDCDRVGVYLWDAERGKIVRHGESDNKAFYNGGELEEWSRTPSPGGPWEQLMTDPAREPLFIEIEQGDPVTRELAGALGTIASILVPIATPDHFLGMLAVSVRNDANRVRPTPDLLDRLSGVAAQATTALQNGRLLDQITYQALHDDLTGLANRAQFADDLRGAVHVAHQRSELVTLFYIDLDRFKPVNDRHGHEVGDKVLTAVGERLIACTRSRDTVARLGGDEFAVLMPAQTTADAANVLARRLADAFSRPFVIDGRELQVGASIGRAAFPTDADTAESLLRLADSAMFVAKRAYHASSPELALGR